MFVAVLAARGYAHYSDACSRPWAGEQMAVGGCLAIREPCGGSTCWVYGPLGRATSDHPYFAPTAVTPPWWADACERSSESPGAGVPHVEDDAVASAYETDAERTSARLRIGQYGGEVWHSLCAGTTTPAPALCARSVTPPRW